MRSLLFLFIVSVHLTATASNFKALEASNVLTGQPLKVSIGKKGLVVVFLSAVCPCSNSHLAELAALQKDYPDFTFAGVHSNTDEEKALTVNYFKQANLPFSVLQDNGAKLANEFRALKTPHAFLLNAGGEVVYRGGVSSSQEFKNAQKKLLRDALEDVDKGRPVRTAESRALGCTISRGGKNVW